MGLIESGRRELILAMGLAIATVVTLIKTSTESTAQGTHYVTNTRPPDAFLSLRSEPSASSGRRIAIVPNGTPLDVLRKQSNGWWFVRVLPNGPEWWALSGDGGKTWIECCVSSSRVAEYVGLQGFRTPSNNIHCMLNDFEPSPSNPLSLRCDIREIDGRGPSRPRSCDLEWGRSFEVTATGNEGERICVGDTTFDDRHPVLQYGQAWQAKGFTCRSEQSGLTCFNAKQHGFSLSRAVQRMF